ncbi:MAG TPA: hypothetical protein DEP57_10045 [Selenomonas sp.]|nr:hypothetical protein [Selenomonadaceae bacterium]HCB94124.1 hypothetical protein [Selenomonas sp.]
MNNDEKILAMLESLSEDVKGIKADVNGIKVTVQENCDMIKAMAHSLETLDAKMDGLQNTTASLKQMQEFKRNMSEKLRELANGIMP